MPASQTQQALWMAAGYILLLPFCIANAWEPCQSTINPDNRPPRTISQWKWAWLNTRYNNREDGVSGAEALIWAPGESKYPLADRVLVRVYYRPNTPAWARAWLWSAWRNSTNELSR